MKQIPAEISCCYLYVISKYGYPPPAGNTVKYLEEMKALGFSSVELEGIRREHLLEMYAQRTGLSAQIKDLGLSVPYFCAVLPGLGSQDSGERKENIALFRKGCEVAKEFGALGILDNAPLPPYQFPDDIPVVRHYEEELVMTAGLPQGLNWPQYWKGLVETYREACDIAADMGLTYQMHPCAGVLSATTDAFLYFAAEVNRSNLRFNFDTANQFFLKDNLSLSLLRLAEHIDYIHLSDNSGSRVEHLVPGEGAIHWDQFFLTLQTISFRGHFGIDIGGEESGIADINKAYGQAADWLREKITVYGLKA